MTAVIDLPADQAPFDVDQLDRLLEKAGIEVMIVSSKHNVQYLMSGYRASLFDYMDAVGVSRYLPLFVYRKGDIGSVAYYGQHMEVYDKQSGLIWVPNVDFDSHGSVDAMERAIQHIKSLGVAPSSIGVERSFLPADAEGVLRDAFSNSHIKELHYVLEQMRAVKTPAELSLLREASERVEAAMVETFAQARPGMTKYDVAHLLNVNQVKRGLKYEYVIMTADANLHRNPSNQQLLPGGKMTMDSGGNCKGYIGDICRVGCFGDPDQELLDLLAAVDDVQQAVKNAVRAGAMGGDTVAAAEQAIAVNPFSDRMKFIVHGMGLVTHERPQLTKHNPHGYKDVDAQLPLQSGMILSIESMIEHPVRGYVKLEDTVAVTDDGYEGFGESACGWNPMGVA